MGVTNLLSRVQRHVGLIAEILGYLLWLLIDVSFVLSGMSTVNLVAGTVVPLLVLRRRLPGVELMPAMALALGVSIAISTLMLVLDAAGALGSSSATDLSFAEQLALAVLIAAVLRICPLPAAVVLTTVAAVAVVGSPLLRSGESVSLFIAVLSALGWGGAVGVGLLLRDAETRHRALLDEVRSTERMEVARELHDIVAHHVTGIVVAAQSAAVVAHSSPDDVDRALAAIKRAGADAMTAMRSMVAVLRGQDAEGARTPHAELSGLPALIDQFDPDGHVIHLTCDPGLQHAALPAGVAATGYRTVQEALTNARRHAPCATAVEVDVAMREEALLITVHNDGVSASGPGATITPRGFGLIGMAERVTALGGDLTAGPTAPDGWTVTARIPLAPPDGIR